MSDPTLFRRAYTRGLNAELIRTGAVQYASKEAADVAADYVADHSGMPDPISQGDQINLKVAHQLCLHLKTASDVLAKDNPPNPALQKTAASADPGALASTDCFELMQKVAAEIEGDNTEATAAQHDDGAAMDVAARPEGYAHTGVGNYEGKGLGAIGLEVPGARTDRAEGSNSAIESSAKQAMAAAAERLKRASNSLTEAAKTDDGAALDKGDRPEGYANKGVDGVGQSDNQPSGTAILGKTSPMSRDMRASGSNSATKHAEARRLAIFDKVAQRVLPWMPKTLSDKAKVAHVNALTGLSPRAQSKYLETVYGTCGLDKTAAAQYAGAFLKQAMDEEEKAKDEAAEDFEVAQAMEQAAEEIEDDAVEDLTDKEASARDQLQTALSKLQPSS